MNRVCANLNVLARFNDRYAFSGDALRAEIRNIQETGTTSDVNKAIKPLVDQLVSSNEDLPYVKLLVADKELRGAYQSFQLAEEPIEKSEVFPQMKNDIKEYILIVYWALRKLGNLVLQWPCYPIYKWVTVEINKMHQEFVDDIVATAPSVNGKPV